MDGETSLTVASWNERANATGQGLLQRGVRRGDRVGLVFGSRDWADYAVAFAAVTSAGAIAVPLAASLPASRIRSLLDHCGASLVITASDLPWAPGTFTPSATPDDVAQIIYTSGTTGEPKGVTATHANLTHGLSPLAHSRFALHAFPIGTNAAQTMLLTSLVARPTIVVQSSFDPIGFAALAARCESVFVVPAMAIALLDNGCALPSVELIASSAAPLPPAVARRLTHAYPDATIVNSYTSTEAAPAFTTMIYDPARPGSVGRPLGTVRVDEDGEIWLRSPTTTRTYYGDPAASAATFRDGWVRMGDRGYVDPDGYLYLTDRDADVVKTGGHKVSTQRIEAALYEHPAVVEAAVLGLPHPVMGSVLAAAIVTRRPVDVRAFLSESLAPHEIPARVRALESLPRNASGKVAKRELKPLFEERAAFVAPSTPSEVEIAALWKRVLNVRDVGVGDDFFALGGDSLTATRLAALLGVPVSQIFDCPILAHQARLVGSSTPDQVEPGLHLTATQESLLAWTYAGEEPRDAGPISVGVRVRDDFDPDRFEAALRTVVRRHEALRMVFDHDRPRVVDDLPPVVTLVPASAAEEAEELVRADREGRFDLAKGPLVRAIVVRLAPQDHVIGLAVHHLVFDGASMGVLLHELGLAYSGSRLPPSTLDYREYVSWTRAQWAVNEPYWESALDGAPANLEPFAGRKPALRTRTTSLEFGLGPSAVLREYGAAHGATAFQVIATAWASALARASGLDDIVLLTPVPGRSRPGSESLIGCLVQSMMLRIRVAGEPFADLLAQVKSVALAGLDHQYHPFARYYQRHPGASFLRVESWGGQAHLPGLVSEQFDLPRALEAEWPTPDGLPDLQAPELAVVEQPDGGLKAWLLCNDYAFDRSTMDGLARLLEVTMKELR